MMNIYIYFDLIVIVCTVYPSGSIQESRYFPMIIFKLIFQPLYLDPHMCVLDRKPVPWTGTMLQTNHYKYLKVTHQKGRKYVVFKTEQME